MKVLLIIDMQPFFCSAKCEETLRACRKEIKRAIKAKETICFVEYKGMGRSAGSLLIAAKGYSNVRYVIKKGCDGSNEVLSEFRNEKISQYRVCGVNAGACVYETMKGIIEKDTAKIVAVCDAINDEPGLFDIDHVFGWYQKEGITLVKGTRKRSLV